MKSVVSGVAGSVRLKQLTRAGITIAEKHGKRLDKTGKARAINDTPALTNTGLDLNALYDAHVKDVFIPVAKTKAMHMIFQFPKELVDPGDSAGMLHHARAYAERVFGPDAVFADRIDRDEKNKQVVDLFIAPKYVKRLKKSEKVSVSMTRDLKRLAEKHGHPPIPFGIGRAMQDELFEYFRDIMKLDGVERGAKKVFAGDDWKSAEQQQLEKLEKMERDLEARAAALDTRAGELDTRAADLDAREAAIEAKQEKRDREIDDRAAAVGKHSAIVAVEAAQAKLLLRAIDDDSLQLSLSESGKPKMNETAMKEPERMAYRAAWSERMLELARFVANALQAMRAKIAAVVKRERAVKERETALLITEQAAQERLDAASTAEERVTATKTVAEAFMTAWEGIPEDRRSPPVRDAIIKADALLKPEKQPAADPGTTGTPKSRAEALAALRGLGRGPDDGKAHLSGGLLRPSGRDEASR